MTTKNLTDRCQRATALVDIVAFLVYVFLFSSHLFPRNVHGKGRGRAVVERQTLAVIRDPVPVWHLPPNIHNVIIHENSKVRSSSSSLFRNIFSILCSNDSSLQVFTGDIVPILQAYLCVDREHIWSMIVRGAAIVLTKPDAGKKNATPSVNPSTLQEQPDIKIKLA